jgi:hypothetical protein
MIYVHEPIQTEIDRAPLLDDDHLMGFVISLVIVKTLAPPPCGCTLVGLSSRTAELTCRPVDYRGLLDDDHLISFFFLILHLISLPVYYFDWLVWANHHHYRCTCRPTFTRMTARRVGLVNPACVVPAWHIDMMNLSDVFSRWRLCVWLPFPIRPISCGLVVRCWQISDIEWCHVHDKINVSVHI